VIVMDLSLPGHGRLGGTRRPEAGAADRDIPVIALTGHALTGSEHTAREAGCDRFLTKPCAPAVLGQEIPQDAAGRRPGEEELGHHASHAEAGQARGQGQDVGREEDRCTREAGGRSRTEGGRREEAGRRRQARGAGAQATGA
jgi:CheY-like chemotaxis protein